MTTVAAATTWQGAQLWAATSSSRQHALTATYHGTTDRLDGRALCGAWVYEIAGRIGVDQIGARGGWPETYAGGEPMLYRVTCKRCAAKLATAPV